MFGFFYVLYRKQLSFIKLEKINHRNIGFIVFKGFIEVTTFHIGMLSIKN